MDWRISPCVIRCTKADTSDKEQKDSRAEKWRERETAKRPREGDEGVASPARNRDRRKKFVREEATTCGFEQRNERKVPGLVSAHFAESDIWCRVFSLA